LKHGKAGCCRFVAWSDRFESVMKKKRRLVSTASVKIKRTLSINLCGQNL